MKRTGPEQRVVDIVRGRAMDACERCGLAVSMDGCQVHHRQPRGAGGSRNPEINSPANLLLLCSECHTWVESNRTTSYEQGWLVHRGHNPEKCPVWLAGRGFSFLTIHGDVEEIDDDD